MIYAQITAQIIREYSVWNWNYTEPCCFYTHIYHRNAIRSEDYQSIRRAFALAIVYLQSLPIMYLQLSAHCSACFMNINSRQATRNQTLIWLLLSPKAMLCYDKRCEMFQATITTNCQSKFVNAKLNPLPFIKWVSLIIDLFIR